MARWLGSAGWGELTWPWHRWRSLGLEHLAVVAMGSKHDHLKCQPCHQLINVNYIKIKYHERMKPTNPNADTYAEEQRQYFFVTISSEPTCGTPWLDTLKWHCCRTPLLSYLTVLWDTLAWRSCKTLVLDTLVRHSYLTLLSDTLTWHSCKTHLVDTLTWHSCKTLVLDTLVRHSYLTLLSDTLTWHSCKTHLVDTLTWHSCKTLLLDTLVRHSCLTLLLGHSYLTFL